MFYKTYILFSFKGDKSKNTWTHFYDNYDDIFFLIYTNYLIAKT